MPKRGIAASLSICSVVKARTSRKTSSCRQTTETKELWFSPSSTTTKVLLKTDIVNDGQLDQSLYRRGGRLVGAEPTCLRRVSECRWANMATWA